MLIKDLDCIPDFLQLYKDAAKLLEINIDNYEENIFPMEFDRVKVNKFLLELGTNKNVLISVTSESVIDAEIERTKNDLQEWLKVEIQTIKSAIVSRLQHANESLVRSDSYRNDAYEMRLKLDHLEGNTIDLKTEITKLMTNSFWQFNRSLVSELLDDRRMSGMLFTTRQPVIVRYTKSHLNYDKTVDFGKYALVLNISNGTAKILPWDNNIFSNEYYHPYINSNGRICFGNAESEAQSLMFSGKYDKLFQLIAALLSSYDSSTTPYESFESFQLKAENRVRCKYYCLICDEYSDERCEHYCSVCERYIEVCGCCHECNNTERDCTCCDICGGTNREDCGCCHECNCEDCECEGGT